MVTDMNTLQRSYRIHHFTLIVSPHYLAKLRTKKKWIEHTCKIDAQLVNDHFFECLLSKCNDSKRT